MKYYFFIILSFFFLSDFEDNMVLVEVGDNLSCKRTKGKEYSLISIDKKFFISKHEVTVQEFSQFIEETGYITQAEKKPAEVMILHFSEKSNNGGAYFVYPNYDVCWKNAPDGSLRDEEDWGKYAVTFVSWNDAQEYCKWKTIKTGKKYRLPTKEEWMYAAKGGNKSKNYVYSGSNDLLEVSHTSYNSEGEVTSTIGYPVKSKNSNELGIYDMTGGVAEWASKSPRKDYTPYEYAFCMGTAYTYVFAHSHNLCDIVEVFTTQTSPVTGFRVVMKP